MPGSILPNSSPVYDYDISGPYPPMTAPGILWNNPTQFALGVTGAQNYTNASAGSGLPRIIDTNTSVGGGASNVQAAYKGIQARSIAGGGVGRTNIRFGGIMVMPLIDRTGLDSAYSNPSWRRVQRFAWGMAMSVGATLDGQSGMLYAANPGGIAANVQWPSGAATIFFGGFGVIGDGAGDWQWRSFGAGPPPNPITETVALSGFYADAEEWNTFEIITISSAGDRTASLELRINNVTALTRDWVNAPVLFPLGPTAGVETYHYIPTFQGGLNGTTHVGDWRYRCGRFLPGGRELLT